MTSTIKVDNIQKVSDGSNIIKKCGSTITLGSCGQTVAIATGATTSGMGRTGTVDWQTGSIKTSTFTAESGKGYFCNTAGGSFEVDLPAGSAGAIVSIQDYNNTFDSNSLTVDPNGSEKINGGTGGGEVILDAQGQGITLVYIDSTVGWRSVQENEFDSIGTIPAYVTASGGNTVSTSGNFKIHVFTAPGTFTVSCAGNTCGSNTVDYLVVAGGGGTPGGGYNNTPASGAGAGGFRASASTFTSSPMPAHPLVNGVSALPVAATGYPITVGAGGSAGSAGPGNAGGNGADSVYSTITSAGGGKGGHAPSIAAGNGGSGAGGGKPFGAGSGNTPPVSPPQGNPGGVGTGNPANPSTPSMPVDNTGLGGGGGALASGSCGGSAPNNTTNAGGDGGDGAGFTSGTWGSSGHVVSCVQYYAGGGGGGVYTPNPAPGPGGIGGLGGGGNGGSPANPGPHGGGIQGQAGTANTGGGASPFGGAPSPTSNFSGNAGGSGIVVIRYRFQ